MQGQIQFVARSFDFAACQQHAAQQGMSMGMVGSEHQDLAQPVFGGSQVIPQPVGVCQQQERRHLVVALGQRLQKILGRGLKVYLAHGCQPRLERRARGAGRRRAVAAHAKARRKLEGISTGRARHCDTAASCAIKKALGHITNNVQRLRGRFWIAR